MNISTFISLLESRDELIRIHVPVDPVLEIAALTDRVCKQPDGGPALLFEQPCDSSFSVATNLFGSVSRVCHALQLDSLTELTERMGLLLHQVAPLQLASLDASLTALPDFSRYAPHAAITTDSSLVQQTPIDLSPIPFLHNWPDDGSASDCPRYLTLPQVYTAAPDGSSPNCGMYRVQLRGSKEIAIACKPGSGAARHLEQHRLLGKPMPVAITLGGPTAVIFSSLFPLPGELDELAFAGWLRQAPLSCSRCHTVPLIVPSGCELLIEGYVAPDETVTEGPFGNYTGRYASPTVAPLLRVTSVSYRENAVIPATVVGPPPMEDCWMMLAWERVLLALVQRMIPAVVNISFPLEWVFYQSAIISLDHPNPAMVRETAHALWALPWFVASKMLVFVDQTDPPLTTRQTAWLAMGDIGGSTGVILDETGQRMALDATGSESSPRRVARSNATEELLTRRWREYGIER